MLKWVIGNDDSSGLEETLARECGLSRLSAAALISMGICDKLSAAVFFGKDSALDDMGLYDPLDIPGMAKAAELLDLAVSEGRRICIYGDYDCDGILATAGLYNYLSGIGADVTYFINERADGYGMNIANVRRIAENGAEVIVTVDNGIAAFKEAELCRELGVQLIVTDHHTPQPELPDADAITDPHIDSPENKLKFRDICGCTMVMKLISAMEGSSAPAVEMMSDFAAVASVGDVMPLVSENRTIVKHGLHFIENTENPGMKALLDEVLYTDDGKRKNLLLDAHTVAFTIVPRINASGRMGSAMDAAEMFTTDDPARAAELAAKICRLNDERKSCEDKIVKEIYSSSAADPSVLFSPVVAVSGDGWHKGVIGIAASRLCDRTGKPSFVVAVDDGYGTGSARAPEGYSVYEALYSCRDMLTKFGGHVGAGGFTVPAEKIDEFFEKLRSDAEGKEFEPTLKAVRTLAPHELSVEEITRMRSEMEPFGERNPAPVFLLAGAAVKSVDPLSGGKYTKITIDYGGSIAVFPMFDTPFGSFPYEVGDRLNIMGVPATNTFRGNVSVTLDVKDIRRSGVNQSKLLNAEREYLRFRGGNIPEKRIIPIMIPQREEYAAVYRALPPEKAVNEEFVFGRFSNTINLCKLHIILDVFDETGLIKRDVDKVTRLPVAKGVKVDFSETEIIKRLQALL